MLISNIILLWSQLLYIISILWKFLKLLRCATQHIIYFRLVSMCTWICILTLSGTVLHRSPLGEVSAYCYSSVWYPHWFSNRAINYWVRNAANSITVDFYILSVLSVYVLCILKLSCWMQKHLGLLSLLEKMVLLSFMKCLSLSLVFSWNHFILFYD